MPQGPIQTNVAVNQVTLKSAPLQMDGSGNLLTGQGSVSKLNVTAPTVIKATAGRVVKVCVSVAGTGTFGVYDTNATGSAAAANAIYAVTTGFPAAGTVLSFDFPCLTGIVVNPGASGVVSVSFD